MLSIGLFLIILSCSILVVAYYLHGILSTVLIIASAIISTIGLIILIITFIKNRKEHHEQN